MLRTCIETSLLFILVAAFLLTAIAFEQVDRNAYNKNILNVRVN